MGTGGGFFFFRQIQKYEPKIKDGKQARVKIKEMEEMENEKK